MGGAAKKLMQSKKPREPDGRQSDRPQEEQLRPDEANALKKIRREAAAVGSFLTSGGKGGLDPSLVLNVMRRDEYRCKSCGEIGDEEENQGIGVHHIGGIVTSQRTSRLGHQNKPSNLVTICGKCHDHEHNEARENGEDSSQVLPSGDKGNPRRDHGQPTAKVDRAS